MLMPSLPNVNAQDFSADLSIVRRHIPGKMLVALNVMWTHLGQQSFPMSEEEYMDKLDTIAYYLRHVSPIVAMHTTLY